MSENLFLDIEYDINKDEFSIKETNIKESKISDVVVNFLRGQMGKGADDSEANKVDVYSIRIELDLSFDRFSSRHNCGNLGLRDGILQRFLSKCVK